ncbi:MAG: phage tail protein [Chloroflexi bacterium]|nr:phage tail protein [Chloroflexota bacterium]
MANQEDFKPDEKLLSQAHPAFRFVVKLNGIPFGAFTECTLPTLEWEVEEVKEGGLNTHVHQLPGRRKSSSRLTLKYGVCKDELWEWYKDVMSEKFEAKNITVELLDVSSNTVAGWYIQKAYPVKWSGPQLQASSTAIAIQSLEFACGEITLDPADMKAPAAKRN